MSKSGLIGRAATGFLFPLYAGLILGVSFLATMAKFQAQHSTMAQLVEIGTITFHWLHAVELFLVLAVFSASILSQSRWRVGVSIALVACWAAQQWWLFPMLDSSSQAVIDGGAPASGSNHMVFAALETVKILMLMGAGIACSVSSKS